MFCFGGQNGVQGLQKMFKTTSFSVYCFYSYGLDPSDYFLHADVGLLGVN